MDKIQQEECPSVKPPELAVMLRTPAITALGYLSTQLLALPMGEGEACKCEGWWTGPTTS